MDRYDVAVVGGGIAGMICASYLSRFGKRVVVLEQNHHTGGNMSGFSRKGYYFDGGDQSFESLGLVFPILQELGVYDAQEWQKLRYRMVSKDFDFFVDSIDDVQEALCAAFPKEPGLSTLFDEVRQVSRFLDQHCDAWSFPLIQDFSLGKALRFLTWLPRLRKWLTFTYREKACSAIRDPSLRNWLTSIGYYRMPYIFFAGFWHIWMKDYWYPKGGMQKFHDTLAASFTSSGGSLRCNTSVHKIDIRDGRATGVVTDQGESIPADTVVYAGDYRTFVGTMVDRRYFKQKFVRKIHSAGLTEEILATYLGLNMTTRELGAYVNAHHVFYFPNYDVIFPNATHDRDVHRRMWVALNYFGGENPDSAPPDKSTLVLQTYSSFDWEHYWRNTGDSVKRTPEYREFKAEIGNQLVELAENVVPNLRNRIDYFDVGTPLTIKRFSRNSNGSTGGWCYDDKVSPVYNVMKGLSMFGTPFPNVWATGHYTLWPGGVISAALSGKIVANLVTGRRALAKLS